MHSPASHFFPLPQSFIRQSPHSYNLGTLKGTVTPGFKFSSLTPTYLFGLLGVPGLEVGVGKANSPPHCFESSAHDKVGSSKC
mmetsp:Transcript_26477/g.45067  ORF Transcript_26477/g.45067 Transcript_26477/m.45067 type:complete len:83 (-) Transcript_26477:1313-1561(-)